MWYYFNKIYLISVFKKLKNCFFLKLSTIFKLLIHRKLYLIKNKAYFRKIKRKIFKLGASKIDYIKIFDINKLIKPYKKKSKYRIFIAYYLGTTRLIDNI